MFSDERQYGSLSLSKMIVQQLHCVSYGIIYRQKNVSMKIVSSEELIPFTRTIMESNNCVCTTMN